MALADELIREFAALPPGVVLRQLASAGTALRHAPRRDDLDQAVARLARRRLQALLELRGLPRPRPPSQL